MNVFGKNERSWRKARKRGVSPIIATILLVAITVVLAAVLYVLISGLTGGGVGSKPIGTAFAAGNPTQGKCWAAGVTAHVCATAGDLLVNLTVEQSTVGMGNVLFEVKTSSGSAFPNTAAASFAIMPLTGLTTVGYYPIAASAGLAMTSGWTYTGTNTGSTAITTTNYIVIDTGIAAGSWIPSQGNYFVVLGTSGYSGTTSGTTLP